MSQHAVEDLIEASIHLIDRSALPPERQAALIHALLQLQARYDTGLTWLRMIDVLLRHGVLTQTPAATLADPQMRAQAMAAERSGWLEGAHGAVYLRLDDQRRLLYQSRVIDTQVPLDTLFHAMLTLADHAEAPSLFADWYGLLVNGWLEEVFTAQDGIAPTLDGLLASEPLQAIRGLAARRGLPRRRGVADELSLPRLADHTTSDAIERTAGLRFFLQPKRTPKALRTARDQAQAQHQRLQTLIPSLVLQRLAPPMQANNWSQLPSDAPGHWCWMRDHAGSRQLLWLQHDPAIGELSVHLGLQHAQLLAWQQQTVSTHLHAVHFYTMASAWLAPELRTSRAVGAYGGWALDVAASDTHLSHTLNRLAEGLPTAADAYFSFLAAQFPLALLNRDPDTLLQLLDAGDANGVVPPEVLFDSPDSLLLAFVFQYQSQGEQAAASAMVARLRERLQARSRLSPWHRTYLQPFVQQWEAGRRDLSMPPVLHALLVKHMSHLPS
ncbi:hypothetical protein [Xanthomonas maliensis]|uniref:hypothetical protein n=1 Tax=Xanthomonas maliensis TaxID=1321368 RepID=UPI0003A97D90|nr:hypothetical protein [Xanthomonas maliensis]KAB7772552.1 hypothetical protein CKY51_00100 [Xanthomonas maliensis]